MYKSVRRTLAAGTLVACTAMTLPGQVPGLTGTIIVTNKRPATATFIDVATGRTLAVLPTGRGPHEIALSKDGTLAVITDYETRQTPSLTVIDVAAMKVLRTIELGEYLAPHGLVVLPGDSLVAVTSERSSNLVLVNFRNGSIVRAIGTQHAGSHMVGVTADGSLAYTGDMQSATVTEIDLRKMSYVRSWSVPTTPEAINVTPDGKEVWVGSNATGKVTVLEPSTGAQRTAAEGVKWPYRVLFTPDLSVVVIPDMGNDEVRFLDRGTFRELSRLELPGAGPQGVILTPDGKYLFLSLSKQSRIAVVDMKTRQIVAHLEAGETPDGLAYSPRAMSGASAPTGSR